MSLIQMLVGLDYKDIKVLSLFTIHKEKFHLWVGTSMFPPINEIDLTFTHFVNSEASLLTENKTL